MEQVTQTSRKKIGLKDVFVWILVIALMSTIAIGEIDVVDSESEYQGRSSTEEAVALTAEPAQASVVEVMVADAGDATGTSVEVTGVEEVADVPAEDIGKEKQSIFFKQDTRIRDALRSLSARYQKNIVPSPNVDGVLAFTSLYDVTFEEAMEAILGMDLRYERQGQLIKVYTKAEYKKMKEDKDRMVAVVFKLYYISAAEVMQLVKPVLSNAAKITGSSPADNILPTGESISAGSGGGDDMALHDTVVIMDYPENVNEAQILIEEVDVRPRQVLIEATILSATLTEGMDLGVDLSLAAGVSFTSLSGVQGITNGTPVGTQGFASLDDGLRVGVTSGDFVAFITALETVTDTTILANPKILAINKQLGQVYIGTKIGYREGDVVGEGGVVTEGEVKFLETGTKLSFRPYIGNDGYIRMDIHPKDSSGSLNEQGVPDEVSAELATNIMVKDGETIVIGGLFRDVVTTTRKQVPLLGDLPLIGGIFRSISDSTTRQEVIVLLTPHIIEEPEETQGHIRQQDISRKHYGAQDELFWMGRGKLADEHYEKAARYYVDGAQSQALEELEKSLNLRPGYLEALRLKERVLEKIDPEQAASIKRKVLDEIESQDNNKWYRK